jgi:hypothetical protein
MHDIGTNFLLASIMMAIPVTSLQIILLVAILAKNPSCNNICKEFDCNNP